MPDWNSFCAICSTAHSLLSFATTVDLRATDAAELPIGSREGLGRLRVLQIEFRCSTEQQLAVNAVITSLGSQLHHLDLTGKGLSTGSLLHLTQACPSLERLHYWDFPEHECYSVLQTLNSFGNLRHLSAGCQEDGDLLLTGVKPDFHRICSLHVIGCYFDNTLLMR